MKILVIRRDNIGDLVCTTPLLAALRQRFPQAWIGVLANSYNAPVLTGNPDVDEVFAYRKAKHREGGASLLRLHAQRLRLIWGLRRMGIDDVILAAPAHQPSALRFARLIRPRRVLGGCDSPLPHEAQKVFATLSAYGLPGPAPACRVLPERPRLEHARAQLPRDWAGRRLIGIHISARKPSQRWPEARFIALMEALHRDCDAAFLLFWSPGPADHPQHPGDDHKARQIVDGCRTLPLAAMPTHELGELIAGLALCDEVICSDGGAMHIAAGLGKPILCFFGQSSAERWHPWGVPYELLQKESRQVSDISVDEAVAGYERLRQKIGAQ